MRWQHHDTICVHWIPRSSSSSKWTTIEAAYGSPWNQLNTPIDHTRQTQVASSACACIIICQSACDWWQPLQSWKCYDSNVRCGNSNVRCGKLKAVCPGSVKISLAHHSCFHENFTLIRLNSHVCYMCYILTFSTLKQGMLNSKFNRVDMNSSPLIGSKKTIINDVMDTNISNMRTHTW